MQLAVGQEAALLIWAGLSHLEVSSPKAGLEWPCLEQQDFQPYHLVSRRLILMTLAVKEGGKCKAHRSLAGNFCCIVFSKASHKFNSDSKGEETNSSRKSHCKEYG